MPLHIEDYALIGNCQSAALVGRNGSIDWLCFPRFDSGACFAALLGTPEHGRWLLAPACEVRRIHRRYRGDTLVLETEYETEHGVVSLVDCMPPRTEEPNLVRMVVGKRGQVPMRMHLIIRFDYGSIVPWVRRMNDGIRATAGPDILRLHAPVRLEGKNFSTVAEFTVSEGQRVPFVLTWCPSHRPSPREVEAEHLIGQTERWWRDWSRRCAYDGAWREAVIRSLIILKALTYTPTGGIVAAVTTSLPEQIGGVRNWDYRYCWLRDATFTLYALMMAGYEEEAYQWRDWLLQAVAGRPEELRIMYGLSGERRLPEMELDWLPGYEGSTPVRTGNAASSQFQLDVFGEVMDSFHFARRSGFENDENAWQVQRVLLDFLESKWSEPDEGIWEIRGPRLHFTHSKVMAWVAMDRAVKAVERYGLKGPVERWRHLRATIFEEVCRRGFDAELGSFVQSYGSKELDASLLMLPLVGFLPATDRRMQGTVAAIERFLSTDGLILRYSTHSGIDGLPPGEGALLICTFWLADNYAHMGRYAKATQLFERLLDLRNDVGLLSEHYDSTAGRLLGNFPQVFSHVGLINTAYNLKRAEPSEKLPEERFLW
jgi:GH15 family glucan-1,4-alpha-glucosidase